MGGAGSTRCPLLLREQAGLADSLQGLTAALSEKKDKTGNISRFLSLVKRNLSFEDLIRDVLNTFIQKIVVNEVDKNSEQRVQKIDINYQYSAFKQLRAVFSINQEVYP